MYAFLNNFSYIEWSKGNGRSADQGSFYIFITEKKEKKKTWWPESARELYRPSDRRLSAKLVPTSAVEECRVFSAADPIQP
jgi:hypothetical protein